MPEALVTKIRETDEKNFAIELDGFLYHLQGKSAWKSSTGRFEFLKENDYVKFSSQGSVITKIEIL